MAPPRSRVLTPVLTADVLLAGRYRLVRPLPSASSDAGDHPQAPAELWLAHDEVLARSVAAKVLPAAGRRGAAAARPFLAAAAAAGTVSHPALARVYDAAVEQRPAERAGRPAGDIDVAYVISEWIDGQNLAAALKQDGPWEPDRAVEVAVELAEALAVAHEHGLVHGRIHPGNVLLGPTGAVTLTDLGWAAALPEHTVPARRSTERVGPDADVRDLTAVLYAMLTARWPLTATPQPSGGLGPAPAGREGTGPRGRLISPRQVRAGVPRSLDTVVVQALEHPPTALGLAAALRGAVRADTPRIVPAPPRIRRIPRRVRRLVPLIVIVAALIALGLTAYSLGLSVGTIPTEPGGQAAGGCGLSSHSSATMSRVRCAPW